jgi:hypothetical protein
MENSNVKSGGISFSGALFLLFLGLKLTGYITWSWWWVTAPLWIPFGILIIFLLVLAILAIISNYNRI